MSVDNIINESQELMSPVLSIFGHVDSGKTALTNCFQDSTKKIQESGGITQSNGSYFVDINDIVDISSGIKNQFQVKETILPGLIIIDTPGHSAFSTLRQQGSSLCNMAILVVDIVQGIQKQTEECINILKNNSIPFIVAANKLDLIEGWNKTEHLNFKKAISEQDQNTKYFLQGQIEDIKHDLKEKFDINSQLYTLNEKNNKKIVNIVPISTFTKEGLSDIMNLVIYISQEHMSTKIKYDRNDFDSTIIDSGLDDSGHYIDIILSNGCISKEDKIIVITDSGIKNCSIRRITKQEIISVNGKRKIEFNNKDFNKASCGLRIYGSDLSGCLSGSKIYKCDNDCIFGGVDIMAQAEMQMREFWKKFKWSDKGIYLIAPNLGEFDAVYSHLNENNIPIFGGDIGLIKKISIMKYNNGLEEEDNCEDRIILYFNSKGQKDLEELKVYSKSLKIEIISSDILYELTDNFLKRKTEMIEERKKLYISSGKVAFPVCLKIIEDHIFSKGGKSDFLLGVKVINGSLNENTPLFAYNEKAVSIGNVTSIIEHKKGESHLKNATKGMEVSIKISNKNGLLLGRHFNKEDKLYTEISRNIIDILKKDYRNDLTRKDWELVKSIKELQNIK